MKIYLHFLFGIMLLGCVSKEGNNKGRDSFCEQVNRGDDLYSYWMEEEVLDSLLTVVKACEQTPELVSAKLDLLSLLNRNEEAIQLISTLGNSDFRTSYDSISSLNYFRIRITKDSLVKVNLYEQTLSYISNYLTEHPTDTAALFNFSGKFLKIMPEQRLFSKLDSMSERNDFDPVYEFVISSYIPGYLEMYKQRIVESQEFKSI